jgi:hypothetical protein
MNLTFWITLSLCAFYWGATTENKTRKRSFYLLMFAAMGCGTLIKGPIGIVLPGIVIAVHLMLKKRWSILGEMELKVGALVFLLIVTPWYLWAELRNPGYLRYFLLEENLLRFLTYHFQRSQPWYFFLGVVAIGFLPWTPLIAIVAERLCKRPLADLPFFLLLWTAVPLVFFSLSRSKLAGYILPIYPAMSILAAAAVVDILNDPASKRYWTLSLPWLSLLFSLLYLMLGFFRPEILPYPIRQAILELPQMGMALAPMLLLLFVALPLILWTTFARRQRYLYLLSCLVFFLFSVFAHHMSVPVSLTRSSRELAEGSAGLIDGNSAMVIYDTYLASLAFYLRIHQPIWIVWSGKKSHIMGSLYVSEKRPEPAPGYGQVLFTFDEFSKLWEDSPQRLLVFVKEKNLAKLGDPKRLLQVGEIVLATNQ